MIIDVLTTLFTEENGGRHCMPVGSGYCPYLLVDNSNELVAVRFIDVPESAKLSNPFLNKVQVLYPSGLKNLPVCTGFSFKVYEGKKIVGTGKTVKAVT